MTETEDYSSYRISLRQGLLNPQGSQKRRDQRDKDSISTFVCSLQVETQYPTIGVGSIGTQNKGPTDVFRHKCISNVRTDTPVIGKVGSKCRSGDCKPGSGDYKYGTENGSHKFSCPDTGSTALETIKVHASFYRNGINDRQI